MVRKIKAKSILNKHKKRDDWFLDDYSVNPYSACQFNCIYCYIRGSKYGENLEKTLSVKVNAPQLLEKQLSWRAKRGQYGIIALSSSTEPYMKIEEKFKITRRLLEIILKYRFPVHVLTKSSLVLRDLDLLKEIDREAILPEDLKGRLSHGVIISLSLSTLDEDLAKKIEPGAPSPMERLMTVKKCAQEGLLAGVSLIPALPFLSDSEEKIEQVIKKSKDYGAEFILVGSLTLFGKGPADSRTLYYRFLKENHPELLPKYRSLYRIFPVPPREYQRELDERAKSLCRKHGIKPRII